MRISVKRNDYSEIFIAYKGLRAMGYEQVEEEKGMEIIKRSFYCAATWVVFERRPQKSAGGGVSIFSGSGLHPLSAQY